MKNIALSLKKKLNLKQKILVYTHRYSEDINLGAITPKPSFSIAKV